MVLRWRGVHTMYVLFLYNVLVMQHLHVFRHNSPIIRRVVRPPSKIHLILRSSPKWLVEPL